MYFVLNLMLGLRQNLSSYFNRPTHSPGWFNCFLITLTIPPFTDSVIINDKILFWFFTDCSHQWLSVWPFSVQGSTWPFLFTLYASFFFCFFVILSAIIFFPSPQAPALPIWFSSSDSDTPGNIQMLLIQTSTSYKDIRNWIITNLNLMTIKPKPFLLAHAQSLLSFFVSSLSNLTRQCNYTTIVKFLFLTANSLGIAPNGSPSWW